MGNTALHVAAAHGCQEAMILLIGNGANPTLCNKVSPSIESPSGDLKGYCRMAVDHQMWSVQSSMINADVTRYQVCWVSLRCGLKSTTERNPLTPFMSPTVWKTSSTPDWELPRQQDALKQRQKIDITMRNPLISGHHPSYTIIINPFKHTLNTCELEAFD